MLKIVLCDDNGDALQEYAELISGITKKHQLEVMISCFNSGDSLLFHYAEAHGQIDILYLDILMDKTNGMETARKLRESGCNAQIVFLTSCADYVYDAFDMDAVQYLLKNDTDPDKFERVFLKAAKLASFRDEELFTFEFDGDISVMPIREISYIEIWQRLITVHCADGRTGKFYGRLEQLEEKLRSKDFVRAHRSYLVHLPYIAMFRHQSLLLKTGEEIPVGGTYAPKLKMAFSAYIARFHIFDSEKESKEDMRE